MKPGAWGALSAIVCLSASCTSQPPKTAVEGTTSPPLRMKPIHIRATEDNARLAVDAYDAAGLLDRAATSLRKGQYDDAVQIYRQLVAEFADSDFAPLSLYNSGLCNEHQKKFTPPSVTIRNSCATTRMLETLAMPCSDSPAHTSNWKHGPTRWQF